MTLTARRRPYARCSVTILFSMFLRIGRICKLLEYTAKNSGQKLQSYRNFESPSFKKYDYPPTFVIFIFMAVLLQSIAYGQVELGYRDLLYPDRLMYASSSSSRRQDPLKQTRSLTTRAVITVEDRDQERYLTVFTASRLGHVEFGFPTAENRPTGSLEIFDATRISTMCCPPGIRMVALRHICSDSYLAVDFYGQMRACQLSDDGSLTPLRSELHCLDGERMHTCTDSPYFFLDSLSRMRTENPPSVGSGQPRRYNLRFERKTKKQKAKTVFYAAVTSANWEFKLRAQNSILRRATVEGCQALWQRAIHVLFQRTVTAYKSRRMKRNFRNLQALCDIDPVVIRNYIADNVSIAQFSRAVETVWDSQRIPVVLASSIAWSRMSVTHKNVFVVIAGRIVKDFLRNSLLEVTNLHCLSKTQWGRLSRENRAALLDRSLTLSWIQRKTEARTLVLREMERSMHSRITTFLIREEG